MSFINDYLNQLFQFVLNLIESVPALDNPNISSGLAIILFTLIIKLLLVPLNYKQAKSQSKLMAIQPKLQEIQKKHKGDPEKHQAETVKLYKEHGANPLGGCLPLLIQMPVLFAMYSIVYTHDFAGASFSFIIPDLGAKSNIVLALLSGITTFGSSYLMASKGNDAQAKTMANMNIIMAGVTAYMAFTFKSALGLYWIVSNLIQIGQTLIFRKLGIIAVPAAASVENGSELIKSNSDSKSSKNKK